MKKPKLIIVILILIFTFPYYVFSQGNIGINNDNSAPDPSALLELKSNCKGFLVPRMSTTEKISISSPANGLLVYDTDTGSFWFYNGSVSIWKELKLYLAGTGISIDGSTINNSGDLNPSDDILITSNAGGDLNGTFNNLQIAPNSVTTSEINDYTIHAEDIAANSVTNAKIDLNSVDFNQIRDNAVINSKVADNAIGSAELINESITGGDIGAGAVGTSEIADLSVATSDIADNAVTNAKMYDNSVGNAEMADNAIGSNEIINTSITNTDLADNSVTSEKILNGTINVADMSFTGASAGKVLTSTSSTAASWQVPAVQKILADSDNDTKIQVEEVTDEDIIRFDIGGNEKMLLIKNNNGEARLELSNLSRSMGFGDQALAANLNTGYENSAAGSDALASNTTGGQNNAFGFKSMFYNVSGNGNTAIGWRSLYNTNNNYNTGLGNYSLYSNTMGSYNLACGFSSLHHNVSGSANVSIGYYSGYNNGTGSGNIFIGYSAGYNEVGSNKLYIDNSNTSSPLIYGDFGTNHVGINRVAAANTLEVEGNASKSTPGDWLGNSDARLKKNIRTLNSKEILLKMLLLQGVTFEWNDKVTGNYRPGGLQYGFTAQNIREVFPSLVIEDDKGFLQTSYGTFDAMIVEGLRELKNEIEILKSENKNNELENVICNLKKEINLQNLVMEQMQNEIKTLQKDKEIMLSLIKRFNSFERRLDAKER
jgi:hypothetical protein